MFDRVRFFAVAGRPLELSRSTPQQQRPSPARALGEELEFGNCSARRQTYEGAVRDQSW